MSSLTDVLLSNQNVGTEAKCCVTEESHIRLLSSSHFHVMTNCMNKTHDTGVQMHKWWVTLFLFVQMEKCYRCLEMFAVFCVRCLIQLCVNHRVLAEEH